MYFSLNPHTVLVVWCLLYTYSTSQFRVATFQGPCSRKWLVASVLDSKESSNFQSTKQNFWKMRTILQFVNGTQAEIMMSSQSLNALGTPDLYDLVHTEVSGF